MSSPAPADSLAQDLELPKVNLAGLIRHFGPGMILMMTGIGTSHLVTAPTAGGRFAYALLWCIPIAYISKYYGFETAFRFTHATGKSLIEAYATAWGKWPLWYVLITTVIQSAIGQAGRLIAASAVLYYFFAASFGIELPLAVYGLVLGTIAVGVILRGSYQVLESTTKILAGILFVSTMVVYFVKPAPLETFGHFFSITAPEGSWLIIAAFLGLLPTGIDVSLQASEWGKAKRVGMGRIRSRLEAAGYAGTFDPFNPRREDLSVRTHELPAHVRGVLRPLVQDRALGLPPRARRFVCLGLRLLVAGRWVALSQSGPGPRRDGRDRRHFYRKRRPLDDDGFPGRGFRGNLFDSVQLFRRLAANRWGLLPQPISTHSRA